MKHWLYGALLSVLLLIFLFYMLITFYSIKKVDCLKSMPSVKRQNVLKSINETLEKFENSTNDKSAFNKGFWTLRGYRTCAEKLSIEGNVLWNMRPCPKPFDEGYCFNGGECVTFENDFNSKNYQSSNDDEFENRYVLLCKCAINFQGTRCEVTYDSEVYGFNLERNEVETAALSTLVTVLIICLLAVSCCFYVYRRYGRQGELSSFKTFSTAYQSSGAGSSSSGASASSSAASANNFDRRHISYVP